MNQRKTEQIREILRNNDDMALCEELRYLLQRIEDLHGRLEYLHREAQEDFGECWEAGKSLYHAAPEDLASVAAVHRVMRITEESITDLLWKHERAVAKEKARQLPGQMTMADAGAMIAA